MERERERERGVKLIIEEGRGEGGKVGLKGRWKERGGGEREGEAEGI